jgi:hypothetical protein
MPPAICPANAQEHSDSLGLTCVIEVIRRIVRFVLCENPIGAVPASAFFECENGFN